MKKRIYTTLGYMSMFILFTFIIFAAEAVFIRMSIPVFTIPRKDQLIPCILMNLIGILGIFLALYYSIKFFQWVDIDEKGITARNLVKKIHYREWSQIREIVEGWVPMSFRGGFSLRYYILTDEREDIEIKNGIMRKNSYIMIPCNKKTEKIIKEFYKKEILKVEDLA